MDSRIALAFALAQTRSAHRSVRTWVFGVLAFGITVAVCVYYAYAHGMLADANAGRFQPRFLVAELGAYLLWSILIGCVFAAFDLREADVRSRVVEALDARPFSNLTMIVGRVLGVVAIMALPALATVAVLQATGMVARWAGFWTGDPFEPVSLASFVLLDVLVSLFAWVSMVVLLAAGLRNRMAVLLAAAVLLSLQFGVLSVAPAYLLNAVSVISTTGTWASDIVAEFATADRLAQRCAVLVLGVGCCIAAAATCPRSDGASRARRAAIGGTTILFASAGIVMVALHGAGVIEKRGEWLEAHRAAAANEAATRGDVEAITGAVRIEPGRSLEVDIDALVRTPDQAAHALVFSFNPGMTIASLTLGEDSPPFTHEAGLLTIMPRHRLPPGSGLVLSLRAQGVPDADFGYLDSAVDWRRRSATNLIKYLGTQASLFHRKYVALTPAVHWLPTSGANIDREDPSKRVPDFFHLELDVNVPPGWYVAGPGRQPGNPSQAGFRFRTTTPVAEAALFAAPFERVATEVRGHELELLVSGEHLPNLHRFANATGVIERRVGELLETIDEMGLGYPERTLSLVEAPTSLRTYRGGWRMDALRTPGVLLLREEGLPTTRTGYYDNLVPPHERPEFLAEHLVIYFLNDCLGTNAFQSLGGNLLTSTGPSGDGAVAVDAILRDLAYRALGPSGTGSSVWFTAHDFDTETYFGTSVWEMVTGSTSGHFGNMVGRTSQRPDTWDLAQRTSLATITGGRDPRQSFALLSQMGNAMEDVILGKVGAKGAGSLLGELRRRFEGRGFTLPDVIAVADQVHQGLGEMFDELLRRSALPGFLVSPIEVSRLPDDVSGQARYQVAVHVRNQEPVGGWVSLVRSDYGGAEEPVYVPSNSAVEIGLISGTPPDQLWLFPYLSLNRQAIRLRFAEREPTPTVNLPAFVGSRPSAWMPPKVDGIVVDDLDEGFAWKSAPARPSRWSLIDRYRHWPTTLDNGLPIVAREPGAWTRIAIASSWGAYRRTVAAASPGNGEYHVSFSAELKAGRWGLYYHLPERHIPPDWLGDQGRTMFPALGTMEMSLLVFRDRAGVPTAREPDSAWTLAFDGSVDEAGWHKVGEFELPDGVVRLTVSNRTNGRIVIADAISWRRLE